MKCKLCLKNKELQDSHIIPEFMYRPIYDEKHRFFAVPVESNEVKTFHQKGVREKLLCWDCEQFLSQYEDYARRFFYGGIEIEIKKDENKGNIIISNINYVKLKLFQLTILWRAGVAKDTFFANVSLGSHEEKLRQMLINNNPGESYDYGCILVPLLTEEFGPLDKILLSPDRIHGADNYLCYRFLMAGCLWIYFVSSHSKYFRHSDYFLDKQGVFTMHVMRAENTDLISGIASKLSKKGNFKI